MNNNTRHVLENYIVSSAELAALIGIPMVTVQKWAERGQVDYVKKGRTYLFDRRDFADRIKVEPVTSAAETVSRDEEMF